MSSQQSSYWAVDRLEDRNLAVLENDQGESIRLPRAWLPLTAQEGSVLRVDTGAANGTPEDKAVRLLRFVVDEVATERRRKQAEELHANLPRGPEGDLEL